MFLLSVHQQDNFTNDPEFVQFLNCIDDLEESAQKTVKLLEDCQEGSADMASIVDSQTKDTDGLFMKIDRLSHAVGELEYEVSDQAANRILHLYNTDASRTFHACSTCNRDVFFLFAL